MGALTMPAKVCPRCGEQYEDLRSATCPQCFAKLLVVDEATAEELAAARAAVVQSPEFQTAKAEDDERYREQSFGACLGVLGIFIATVVVIVILIVFAVHRYDHPRQKTAIPTPLSIAGNVNDLTPLPVAGATLADVMPPLIGPFQRRSLDQDVTLPSTHLYGTRRPQRGRVRPVRRTPHPGAERIRARRNACRASKRAVRPVTAILRDRALALCRRERRQSL
jgi:hypothetical protein